MVPLFPISMRKSLKWIAIGVAGGLLASCATTPPQVAVAPPPPPAAPSMYPYHWSEGDAPKAYQQATAIFGPLNLKPGEYKWVADIPKTGETSVVIDTLKQLFYVYRDDKLIGVATVSTGRKGKETPLGFWKVMLKKVKGYSRKYDDAPMPYMQMYDPKGIAFHAGPNPGYPASHGCVRLPLKFAEKLYGLTQIGTKVTIEG
jgi:lipoprotein-anchoring transpeptidase ErfK/SrfK